MALLAAHALENKLQHAHYPCIPLLLLLIALVRLLYYLCTKRVMRGPLRPWLFVDAGLIRMAVRQLHRSADMWKAGMAANRGRGA